MFEPVALNGLKLRNQIVLSPFVEYQAGPNGMVSEQIMPLGCAIPPEGLKF